MAKQNNVKTAFFIPYKKAKDENVSAEWLNI